MPDIIIKDEYGTEDTYTNVSTVKFKTPGGSTVSYQYNPGTDYPWKNGEIRVRWIDYDGTVLKEQWVDQGDGVTNPSFVPVHTGLTFAGWNYTNVELAELNGNVDVGAIYRSSSASSGVYSSSSSNIFVFRCRTGQLSVRINVYYNGANTWEINWGDGTIETKTVTSTSVQTYGVNARYNHTYETPGDYRVTFTKTDGAGEYWFGYYVASTSVDNASYNICGGTNSVNLLAFTADQSISKFGGTAFRNCYSLKTCVLPSSAVSLNGLSYAFHNCYSLQSIVIPDGVTNIGARAFQDCYSLQSIVIPDGVTNIGTNAFQYCQSLQSIVIPDGVTDIGTNAFQNCYSLQSIVIPDGVTNIGTNAFSYCYSLQSIVIPDGVTDIAASLFFECNNLHSISLPNDLSSIGNSAFSSCDSLQSVTIPNSVSNIGNYAFESCYSLQDLYLSSTTPPTAGSGFLTTSNAAVIIHVPSAAVNAYKTAGNWNNLSNYIVGY